VRRVAPPLLLLAVLTFMVGLGRGAITDSDEAFYAEAAREMVEGGDWITPHFNDEPRFQKPILYYWLTAGTFVVTGASEWAARLWAALAGVGLVLVTAACARRWFGDGEALLSGAIVATSFGYYSIGRVALPDLPLTLFITMAICAGWVACLDQDRRRRRWVVAAALALALGFLTKGPVALVIPLIVVVPVVLLERRSFVVGLGDIVIGALVFLVVALPWYAAVTARHGFAYLEGFFIGDNFERFTTDRFNDPRAWWFYVPVVVGGLLPWTPLVLTWAAPVGSFLRRRRDVSTFELRLIAWAIVPLVFFTISVGKQPRYVLPVLPPIAILLAAAILERTRDWRSLEGHRVRLGRSRSLFVGTLAAGGGFVALAALLWRAQPLLINVSSTLTFGAAVVIGLSGAAVVAMGLSPAWRQAPAALAVAAALTFSALQFGALSATGDDTVQQVARAVLSARTADEPIGTYQVFVRNLVFYTRVRTMDLINDEQLSNFLKSPNRGLLVAPAEAVERMEREQHLTLHRVMEFPYFNPARIRLRTLLNPDSARDITRVLVVANR
jgi:4-amino-4-deoxy-L-arabinose transferase-like glycosyltransferase